MSDEQQEKKDQPKAVVAAYIFNSKDEMFLIRSPKWHNMLLGPGGHVEYGETIVDALKREVREETGFEIDSIEFLSPVDVIKSPEFIYGDKHFVAFDYKARLVGGDDQKPVLDVHEATEYVWLHPDEIVKRDDVEKTTKETIKKFILKKEKHGLFNRECKKCEEVKKERDEYKTGWQRALADYKNLQTETEKRRSEWAQMSEVQILEEFLPVYEHLKMSVAHCHSREGGNPDNWLEGVKYVLKQFSEILKSHGVEEIKTVGEKFDPKYHEAVGEEVVEGKEAGEIIKEISGGYRVGERVIRAARVIISK